MALPCTAEVSASGSALTLNQKVAASAAKSTPAFSFRPVSLSFSSAIRPRRSQQPSNDTLTTSTSSTAATTTTTRNRSNSLDTETELSIAESSSSFEIEGLDDEDQTSSSDSHAQDDGESSGGSTSGERRSPMVCDAQSFVIRKLAKCLCVSKFMCEQLRDADLLLPRGVLAECARRILCAAENEPTGLRGCSLVLLLRLHRNATKPPPASAPASVSQPQQTDTSVLVTLGKIKFCSKLISTFELKLTLEEEVGLGASYWWKRKLFEVGLVNKCPLLISDQVTLDKLALFVK